MRFAGVALIIGIIASAVGAQSPATKPRQSAVRGCDQVVSTRPGVGPAYSGKVENIDYDFTAQIPTGLTGWGGVDESAPFHGFTIFLDPKARSCIIFEIHIRVDEDYTTIRPSRAKAIILGKATGWQTTYTGMSNRIKLTNVSTTFSFKQSDHRDDGEILLVAPTSNAHDSMRVYDSFLRTLVFGH